MILLVNEKLDYFENCIYSLSIFQVYWISLHKEKNLRGIWGREGAEYKKKQEESCSKPKLDEHYNVSVWL